MVTSPLYDTTRKILNRANVVATLTASILEQRETGRIIVKSTGAFRYDPYGIRVLENREYPTPVYTTRKTCPTPTAAEVVLATAPKKPVPAAPIPEPVMERALQCEKDTSSDISEKSATPSEEPVCRVLVEFKRGEDVYVSNLNLKIGDYVLVEGDRGQDMGQVTEMLPLKGASVAHVVSLASTKERDALLALRKEEAAAVRLCQQRVKEHSLKMKIEDVEFQYDGGKVTIYYSSSCAVDFRQLQRQLFRDFRCRVWLRTVPASS